MPSADECVLGQSGCASAGSSQRQAVRQKDRARGQSSGVLQCWQRFMQPGYADGDTESMTPYRGSAAWGSVAPMIVA